MNNQAQKRRSRDGVWPVLSKAQVLCRPTRVGLGCHPMLKRQARASAFWYFCQTYAYIADDQYSVIGITYGLLGRLLRQA